MLMIGWTTLGTKEEAELLASRFITGKLAICVQIDGPILSIYHWKGVLEKTPEFRLSVKFLVSNKARLESCLAAHHPCEIPEWIVVHAEHVAEKYLSWAQGTSTSAPL